MAEHSGLPRTVARFYRDFTLLGVLFGVFVLVTGLPTLLVVRLISPQMSGYIFIAIVASVFMITVGVVRRQTRPLDASDGARSDSPSMDPQALIEELISQVGLLLLITVVRQGAVYLTAGLLAIATVGLGHPALAIAVAVLVPFAHQEASRFIWFTPGVIAGLAVVALVRRLVELSDEQEREAREIAYGAGVLP